MLPFTDAEAPALSPPGTVAPRRDLRAELADARPKAIRGHVPALDGLRGLAILLVMLLHFVGNTTATNGLERGLVYLTGQGLVGVDLFFVLSGFLITGILFDSKDEHFFRNFYVRRTLRIFPLYYGVLIVCFIVLPAAGFSTAALDELDQNQAWLWLYGANFRHALEGRWALSYLNHFWSLAIEEHFYLVWPVLVWFTRSRPTALLWTSLGIAAGSRIAGVVAAAWSPSPTIALMTPFQLQGIAFGGALAILARLPGGADAIGRWTPRVAIGAAAALTGGFVLHRFGGAGEVLFGALRPTLFILLLACLMSFGVFYPNSLPSQLLRGRMLRFLGTYSYGLYVYHHFVSYYFLERGTEFALAERLGSHTVAVLVQATAGFAISILAAMASYHLYEKRFLALKDRFAA